MPKEETKKDGTFDYSKLGLKCGLEIHQQLDTNKLFCNCPSILRSDEPHYVVKRRLHVVAGESGEIDKAAKYQASLEKEFVYQGYDTTCLVELDEEPPHFINEEALKIALQISILLNCKILPYAQIMRKTVVDGSNTGGFQRTLLIAQNGWIETESGKVGIQSICLEEDAARIVETDKKNNIVVYRLDRLGIPLIEIATSPDIKTPEQAKEVALFIGDVLRSCKVKRGLGTIRQDVNMSVHEFGGKRIEIKGVQEPDLIVKTIDYEIRRQKELIRNKKEVTSEVRKATESGETEFLRPMPGADRMYPETDLPLLKISRQKTDEVRRNIPQLRKDIAEELRKKGLNQEMIKLLFKQNKIEELKELLVIYDKPELVAKMLLLFPNEIASHEKVEDEKIQELLNRDALAFILEKLQAKKIKESDVKHVMERIVNGEEIEEAVKFEKSNVGDVEEKIHKIIKEKPGLNVNAYMGIVMKEFKGKVDGKTLMSIILKYAK